MNRTDRLVAMVLYLQGRRVVRAEELARRFEISLRTVYRDMAALGEAGVPISGEAGVGYSLVRGYHLPPVMLTADEATALFLGGELVREYTDESLRKPSLSALEKLRAVLPLEQRDQIERTARTTVVIGGVRSAAAHDEGGPAALRPLQDAVARRRVVKIHYRGLADAAPKAREVEPLGVVFYGGCWYLIAWCRLRDALRHFRLDRIQKFETSAETFAAREDFDFAKHIADYACSGPSYPARVWFSDRAIVRARRESYATLVEGARRDGGAEYSLLSWSHDWLAEWLVSFGGDAEALDPPELREKVCAIAAGVLGRHGGRRVRQDFSTSRSGS